MIIALDLGHGISIDKGVGNENAEETIISELGTALRRCLIDAGNRVYLCRPPYTFFNAKTIESSWQFRLQVSEHSNADLFLSLHSGCILRDRGTIIFDKNCQSLAEAISINLNELKFYQNKPLMDAVLPCALNLCSMPGIFLDLLNCHNIEDMAIYSNVGVNAIAEAICMAIGKESGVRSFPSSPHQA